MHEYATYKLLINEARDVTFPRTESPSQKAVQFILAESLYHNYIFCLKESFKNRDQYKQKRLQNKIKNTENNTDKQIKKENK